MLIRFLKPDFEFADTRGSLTQLVHSGWNQVNYITSVAGAIRGGHFHRCNTEAFYVITGKFHLLVESSDRKQHEEYTMKEGDFFTIPPLVAHSFIFLSDTMLISMYDRGVELPDGDKDILAL